MIRRMKRRGAVPVWRLLIFLAIWASILPGSAAARQDPRLSLLCYNAIDAVSRRSGVPREVMLAISLTETGRKMDGDMRPWPWTVNMEGKGEWFDTRDAALAYVRRHFARGARSFDVGCFQINYKWHHQHFSSVEAMFDPVINTTYAAKFLSDLYAEKGNWAAAAGAYHSRTPKYANRYAKRFQRYVARLTGRPDTPVFTGHGSEALELAAAPSPEQKPPRWQPILNLSPGTRLKSPTKSPLGSLVQGQSGGAGLLRRPARALY